MNHMFRALRPDEVELRVNQCKENGFSLLLYKDARCDMNILDETVGALNWQRYHEKINDKEFCTVSIFNEKSGTWVGKSDCGTESNTEKEKGESSDAFKRACTNWGIGRELYTKIFIWLSEPVKDTGRKDKYGKPVYAPKNSIQNYKIADMMVDDDTRKITYLRIEHKGNPVFTFSAEKPVSTEIPVNPNITADKANFLIAFAAENGKKIEDICKAYKKPDIYHMTDRDYNNEIKPLQAIENKRKQEEYDKLEKQLEDMMEQ